MTDKDKVSKTISKEELAKDKVSKTINSEKLDRAEKIKNGEYFEQPPSDSDDEICGPLNCDKQL